MQPVHPVVVVEDDEEIRDSMRDALEIEGYAVSTYSNGKEALDGLRKLGIPCLILLDLMMPVMNGWEFLQAMKAERFAEVPVYVVSAIADQRQVTEAGA